MQTIEFNSYLSSVNDLFPCSTCLVIGVGSGSYIHTLEALGFQDVILVDADEHQLEKMQKMHSLPSSYVLKNALIYKDKVNIPFNIATNPTVSCFKTIDTYKQLMPNVSLLETKELQGYALATFMQSFEDKKINWLIIDTFTALEILSESKESLDTLEVIVCKTLSDTREALDVFMLENDFKPVKYFEENNPKMGVVVYAKDYKNKDAKSEIEKSELIKQLQAEQKVVDSLKENIIKEIQALKVQKTELEQKVTSCQDEQKTLENREKVLVEKLDTKTNELSKLKTEHEAKLKELDIKATQETEAKEVLQKENENLKNKIKSLNERIKDIDKEKNLKKYRLKDSSFKITNLINYDKDKWLTQSPLVLNNRNVSMNQLEYDDNHFKFYTRVDSIGDNGVIKQIFNNKELEFGWYKQGKQIYHKYEELLSQNITPLIIDAGSNIGASLLWFNIKFKQSVIFAIEPDMDNCTLIRANCLGKNIFLFEGALANKRRKLFLNDPEESDWGFQVSKNGKIEVDCLGVNDILKLFNKKKYSPLILKIDIEGGESIVFKNNYDWIEKIPMIIIELHDWLFKGEGNSKPFFKAIIKFNFEVITRGEHLLCFNQKLLKEV